VTKKVFSVLIPASIEQVWEFHSSVEALRILTPSNRKVTLLSDDVEVRNGALHKIQVRQFGVPIEWHALISEVQKPHRFVDTAQKSPFKYWQHQHDFTEENGGTRMTDTITYEMPFGPFGELANKLFVSRDLDQLFKFRHAATLKAFELA
jgi:ligand-binding SRPBCC domain-containing protein